MNNNYDNCNLERLYRIQYQPPEVFTPGRNPAGEQVLVGQLNNELIVAIFFSPDGKYIRYRFYPVLGTPDQSLSESLTSQQSRLIQDAIKQYIHELEMTPCDIRVRHFAFPDWDIGIAEWYLSDFSDVQRCLATGTQFDDDRLIEWQNDKKWILHWGTEFEMSDDGIVLSS